MESTFKIGNDEYEIGQKIYRVEYHENARPVICEATIIGYSTELVDDQEHIDLIVKDEFLGRQMVEYYEDIGCAAGGYFSTFEQALELYGDYMFEFLESQLAMLQNYEHEKSIDFTHRQIIKQLLEGYK